MYALLFRHLRKAKKSSIVARERTPTAVIAMPAHVSLLRRVLPAKQGERQFVCGDRSSLTPATPPSSTLAQYLGLQTTLLAQRGQGPPGLPRQSSQLPSHFLQQKHSTVEPHSAVGYLGSAQPKIHSDITSLASGWSWASWYAQGGVWVKTVADQNTAVEVHLGQRMRAMRHLFILKQLLLIQCHLPGQEQLCHQRQRQKSSLPAFGDS